MKQTNHKKLSIFTYLLSFIFVVSMSLGTLAYGADNTIQTEKGTLTASADDTYLYLTYEGPWDYNIQERIGISVNGAAVGGQYGDIILNTGNTDESQSLQVRDSWRSPIPGASGTVQNSGASNGTYTTASWKIQVPLSTYGTSIDTLGITWQGQALTVTPSSDSSSDTTEATTTESTTASTDSSTEASTDSSTNSSTEASTGDPTQIDSGLVIDGYYDDWKSYPITEITYTSNNTKSIHVGQIYTDGEKVYVHFAMNDLYTTQMQIQQMTLTINGQSFALGVYPVKEDHSVDWDFYNNEMRSLPNGIYKNLGVVINYTQYCDSEAAMTIYDSTHQPDTKGDELEFAFSLKDFQRITGLNTDQISSITIKNPNIGSQEVSWAGTSTAPWIGVTAAVVLCIAGFYTYKHKKETRV